MCDASYTVGPQLYHLTWRPFVGTNSVYGDSRSRETVNGRDGPTFVLVNELYTRSTCSSACRFGKDQGGCCTDIDVASLWQLVELSLLTVRVEDRIFNRVGAQVRVRIMYRLSQDWNSWRSISHVTYIICSYCVMWLTL